MFKPQTIQLSWLPLIASSHWQSILPHPTELTTSSYPSATKILTTQRISTLANPALSLSQIVSKHSGTYYSYISLWDSMYKNSAYLPNHGDLGDSYQASPVTMVAMNTPHAKQIISFASTSQSQGNPCQAVHLCDCICPSIWAQITNYHLYKGSCFRESRLG